MDKLVITPREAATILSTSITTINEQLAAGEIPAYREGRNWKIPKASLNVYIMERAEKEAAARRNNQ